MPKRFEITDAVKSSVEISQGQLDELGRGVTVKEAVYRGLKTFIETKRSGGDQLSSDSMSDKGLVEVKSMLALIEEQASTIVRKSREARGKLGGRRREKPAKTVGNSQAIEKGDKGKTARAS